jgi:hypothetical protein
MGLFGKKQPPTLRDPKIRGLINQAVASMNYGAVQDLHSAYAKSVSQNQLWDVWLDQVQQALSSGDQIGRQALEFARNAGNMDPWGDLSDAHYARIRSLEAS